MKKYELTIVLAEGNDAAEMVKNEISQAGGSVVRETPMGVKTLAYPIKKQRTGQYLSYLVEFEPNKVASFEQELFRQADVLRHLLVEELRFSERQLQALTEKDQADETGDKTNLTELPPTVATSTKPTETTPVEPETTEPVDEGERQKKLEKKLEEMLKE